MWTLVCGCTPRGLEVTAGPSEHVASVLVVASDTEGALRVEYGPDDDLGQRTPAERDGDVAVVGLKAGRAYRWRAVVVDEDGKEHASELATFEVPPPPDGLLPLSVEVAEEEAELGYVAATVVEPGERSWATIFDRDGDYVWWAEAGERLAVTVELAPDGRSLAWAQYDFASFDDLGTLVRIALDGSERTETHLALSHHDFALHDDGTVAFLSIAFADVPIGEATVRMAADTLRVGPEGMTEADEPEVRFSMFDDFPLEPEVTCDHVSEVRDKLGERRVREWSHGNSLVYLPEEDAYYVNDKFTDWLTKIDRASGDVRWVMNGRGGDFVQPGGAPIWRDVADTSLWSHGHFSDLWAGGLLMFDNADHTPGRTSRVIEVAWDEDARTAEVVWEHREPEGRWTGTLGDARRLGADHVLVSWAGLGPVEELTRDHRVVWRARPGGTQIVSRMVSIADLEIR